MNAIYRYISGDGLLRGLNLNAPVNGVRPSAGVRQRHSGRWRRTIAPARMEFRRADELSAGAGTDSAGGGTSGGSISSATTRWPGTRTTSMVRSACLRQGISISSGVTRPAMRSTASTAGFSRRRSETWPCRSTSTERSARHMGYRPGYDDNGDLIFNDRPAGYARNTLVTPETWTLEPVHGLFLHVRPVHPVAARAFSSDLAPAAR